MDSHDRQVIHLRLERLNDMFVLPDADLFSPYRSFVTGIDYNRRERRAVFFYPLTYGRENRVLAVLRDAEVTIAPHEVSVLAPG